ncbi:hypothetical protein GOE02_21545 [Sinorhizobium medicae]|nr:hypothetical protein [Sinorhizobium medicae]
MTTSPASSILAEPQGEERLSPKTLAYVSEAAREQLYDLVVRTCIETGVTKAVLAKRLGKDPAQISRLLGAPGNWTIDTCAELLFAINGSMLDAQAYLPTRKAISNRRTPNCFDNFLVADTTPAVNNNPIHAIVGAPVSSSQGTVGTLQWVH